MGLAAEDEEEDEDEVDEDTEVPRRALGVASADGSPSSLSDQFGERCRGVIHDSCLCIAVTRPREGYEPVTWPSGRKA